MLISGVLFKVPFQVLPYDSKCTCELNTVSTPSSAPVRHKFSSKKVRMWNEKRWWNMYKNLGFGNSVNFSFPIFTQKKKHKTATFRHQKMVPYAPRCHLSLQSSISSWKQPRESRFLEGPVPSRHGIFVQHHIAYSVMIKHHLDSLRESSDQNPPKCDV
jgi:hypothetical protein